MIRPYSLDAETLDRLRQLAVAAYGGRDDLYLAAAKINDRELAEICSKLADDLASHAAFLNQIIIMHDEEPGFESVAKSLLGEEIMKLLKKGRGDEGIVSAVERDQIELRKRYEATIAATPDAEVQSILEMQKRDIEFGEHVLHKISPQEAQDSSAPKPKDIP
jgi:rubrerythrin